MYLSFGYKSSPSFVLPQPCASNVTFIHITFCAHTLHPTQTVFVNTIDAPSLALIVPVVHRGLRDRAGDTKRRAGRIVGNMCTLINDSKVRVIAMI